jgi:alkylation response protein AidB-like acyl-CoA dehydrogenase
MANLETFRKETHDWLVKNAPKYAYKPVESLEDVCWGGRKAVYRDPGMKQWLDVMGARGWTAPTWPKEYGGGGLSPEEAEVLAQEMRALKLRAPLFGFGLNMIGPVLLRMGSETIKKTHIPRIVRGEVLWCQGYSEPGSGSDLASLRTRAEVDGDDYILNGQKIWTSFADRADWMFILVRTDPNAPKHEGITFLLMDMETPGITVKPILLISGASPFCETFLENVRVPRQNVVGEVNRGWTVAKALLGHERTMIAGMGTDRARSDSLVDLARRYVEGSEQRVADPVLRDRIAHLEMDRRAFELTMARSRDGMEAGHQPGPETSFFKLYGTELNQRRRELMLQIAGPQAIGWDGEGFSDDELRLTREWLRSRGNSIEGGTSEIQLNIIAKRVLGLPD